MVPPDMIAIPIMPTIRSVVEPPPISSGASGPSFRPT